jgi:chemotaxis protein methyltransferase CheR
VIAVPADLLVELAALLKERVGLHIRQDSFSALKIAVAARLEELEGSIRDARAYLSLLRSEQGDDELRRLLPLVTVGKTNFFRDERQFRALEALLPPLLSRVRGGGRKLSMWSAGCATGEEPYSIAMTLAEAGFEPEQVDLLATDVNPEAVAFATRGTYDSRRAREVPVSLLERWFTAEGDRFTVRPGLRRFVSAIRPHNLVASAFPRPADGGGFDVIFCRNVIIYFDTATTQQVLTQFHNALVPSAYLFLGYSESLFRLFEGFELAEVSGAFLYRRPQGPSRPSVPAPQRPRAIPLSPPPVTHVDVRRPPSTPAPSTGAAPAKRAEPRPADPAPGPGSPPLAPQEFLDGAIALFADGRFGAARELLERLLERAGEDLAVRLTLANLYGILRQPDRARACYLAALQIEPLSAEAHLFYGIHLLQGADPEGAAAELARALFLDPDLILAHYWLGRCREAQKDVARARLAYRNALEAHRRRPAGKRQAFLGYYPDIPEDGAAFARAAEYALAAL